jgi:glycosyltransferase involved in cell wall biosynthesis
MKGTRVLLKAWQQVHERMPGAILKIIGDGPDRSLMEQSAPSGVQFLGHRAAAEVDSIAASGWVEIIPSTGYDNFPLSALEAMMRGSPLVASDIGGLREIVDPGTTGSLVPPGDVDALAQSVLSYLEDPARSEMTGARGRKKALEKYSEDVYVEGFMALYERILTGQPVG